jgi:hypothetical protein
MNQELNPDVELGIGRRFRRLFNATPVGYGLQVAARQKNRVRNLAEHTPAGYAFRRSRKWFADGQEDTVAFDDETPVGFTSVGNAGDMEYAKGRGKKFFGKLGQSALKIGKGAIQIGAASGLIPGGQLIANLAENLGSRPTPEGVVQAAQTPAEASSVVAALAPSLDAIAKAQAAQMVAHANSAGQAASTAAMLAAAQQNAEAKKTKDKTMLYVGIGGGVLLLAVVLIIALKRK